MGSMHTHVTSINGERISVAPKSTAVERVGQPKVAKLQLNPDGSLVELEPGDWFVCFVSGIYKQWWHPFVHRRHKHVFAMRPAENCKWTLFEPWWTRLLTATITSEQAKKFLRWGALGDVLLVREAIPGNAGQFRGWMNCAALAAYLLGRPYLGMDTACPLPAPDPRTECLPRRRIRVAAT
ncbi:hypothetical protein [Chelativorans xinjiangense]|uniref:hypothetical protein n=1 Tax=Chelativorans xinjiangense TaxID=2681485 RepID=UPI00135B2A4D|nr:hypothetical protein [Chelativorans xinjiangense]